MNGAASLAWKNIRMRPGQSLILGAAIATLAAMLAASVLIEHASRDGLELGLKRLGADLIAVPAHLDQHALRTFMTGEAADFSMPAAVEDAIRQRPFIAQTSSQLYLKSLSGAQCCSVWNVFLIGFDPVSDFTVQPWLSSRGQRPLGPNDILVGAAIQARPGTTLRFFGQPFTVAGRLDAGGMGLDTAVFIPMPSARRMIAEADAKAENLPGIGPDVISAVLIRLKDVAQGGIPGWKAQYELERSIPGISVIRPSDITVKAQKNLAVGMQALYTIGFAVWPMTAVLIGLVFMMAVAERRQEIGLLRAMGATRVFIFRMIQTEALIITGLGALLGQGLAAGSVAAFARLIALKLEVPFVFPSLSMLAGLALGTLGLALVTGMAAAMIPALKACLQEPYEAIRRV